MALIVQTLGSKATVEHATHKPQHLLMADGRSEQYPEAKAVHGPALPRETLASAHFHEPKAPTAASTQLCKPHSSEEARKERQFELSSTACGHKREFQRGAVLLEMSRSRRSRERSRPKTVDTSRHQSTNEEQEGNSPLGWMRSVTSSPKSSPSPSQV